LPTTLPAVLVDGAMVCDREDPPAECFPVAPEPLDAAHDVDEYVAECILAVGNSRCSQVVVHRCRELAESLLDTRDVTNANRGRRSDID
jgi:hypothetical protein